MNAGVVGLHVRVERLEGHREGDLLGLEPSFRVDELDAARARDHVGAVDRRKAVALPEGDGREPRRLERLGAREPPPLVERLPLAHEDEGHLGHGGQVAAGAHGPLLAHDRIHAAVQHLDHEFDELAADPRVAPAVRVEAGQHGRPRVLLGHRVAHACGVGVDQVPLVLADLLRVEDDLGQLADPRVHAVHDLLGGDLVLQQGAALVDPRGGLLADPDGFPASCDLDDVLRLQRVPVEYNDHGENPRSFGGLRVGHRGSA